MLKSLLQNSMKTLTATNFQVGKGTLILNRGGLEQAL